MSVLRPQGKFQDYWLNRRIKRDNQTIALLTNGHLPVWQPAYPVVTLMSRIQATDTQVHASCKWPRISFYVASCVFFSNNREEEAPSHLDTPLRPWKIFILPITVQILLCPITNCCLLPLGIIFHHRYDYQMTGNYTQAVRAKLLGRKPGGLVDILKENPADEFKSNLCCLSRGFNVSLHFLLGPTFWRRGGGGREKSKLLSVRKEGRKEDRVNSIKIGSKCIPLYGPSFILLE